MDGEPPEISHDKEPKKDAITIKGVVNDVVDTFLATPRKQVDGQEHYFMPEDAIDYTFDALLNDDPKLTRQQLFLQLGSETTITPDTLLQATKNPLFRDAQHWYDIVHKIADLDSDKRDEIYRAMSKGIVYGELAKPDNFASPETHEIFVNENQRRTDGQAILDARRKK